MDYTNVYRFSCAQDAFCFTLQYESSDCVVVYPEYIYGGIVRQVYLQGNEKVVPDERAYRDCGWPILAYPMAYSHLLEHRVGAVCYTDGGRVSRFGGRWIPLSDRNFIAISAEVVEEAIDRGYFA